MAKKNMQTALGASLASEQKAVEERFARAESVLAARSVGLEPVAPADSLSAPPPPPVAKVVRDSFTMPEGEYGLIAEVRGRLLRNGIASTKAEVLRAGLRALAALNDAELVEALSALEKVRTGRPVPRV